MFAVLCKTICQVHVALTLWRHVWTNLVSWKNPFHAANRSCNDSIPQSISSQERHCFFVQVIDSSQSYVWEFSTRIIWKPYGFNIMLEEACSLKWSPLKGWSGAAKTQVGLSPSPTFLSPLEITALTPIKRTVLTAIRFWPEGGLICETLSLKIIFPVWQSQVGESWGTHSA